MNRLSWIRAATLCAVLAGAAGCGQKGALYLPEHNGTVITRQGTNQPGAPQPGAPQTSAPEQTPATPPAADPTKKNTNSDDSPAK